jgi:uncharacterized membrane protein YhdT
LFPFFIHLEHSWIGRTIQASTWLFPVIESIHLIGLGTLAGSILVVDMRLLGLGLRGQSVEEVAAQARPWMIGSLALMIATGTLLFLSEATKCYYSFAFWFKMSSLLLVILFTFAAKNPLIRKGIEGTNPLAARAAAIVSLGLWFGVAWGGRWIGFS